MNRNTLEAMALVVGGALCLAACAPEQPTEYETDTIDKSGGELIVEEENPDAVEVELPETEMTNAPAQDATTAPAE